jgi:hypothetical protein
MVLGMATKHPSQIRAEIEALKARIKRLRLEQRAAALKRAEKRLLELAQTSNEGGDPNAK